MSEPRKEDSDSEIRVSVKLSGKSVSRIALAFISSVTAIILAVIGLRAPDETPVENRHGWNVTAFESEETAQIVGQMPDFEITGPNGERIVQDNSKANVRLWDAVLSVHGQQLENVPQQIGDCVSHAFAHAMEFLVCVEMKTGPPKEFHRIFAPYTYGVSRVQIGRGKIRGDGSCMAWAVQAGQQYGVLRVDAEGVPPYSGELARRWGQQGPPQEFLIAAKMYSIATASQVRSAHAIRDAICNGYPVPFGAGNIGWDRVQEKYGRLVGVRSGQWAHAQCVCGYDGSGPEPLYCILNSWGPRAGGKSPIDGSPPGSYWITEKDMEFVARQGDAFAISGFAGFTARKINFSVTDSKEVNHAGHQYALAN